MSYIGLGITFPSTSPLAALEQPMLTSILLTSPQPPSSLRVRFAELPIPDREENDTESIISTPTITPIIRNTPHNSSIIPILRTSSDKAQFSSLSVHFAGLPIPDRREKRTEYICPTPTIIPILRTASDNTQPSSLRVHFAELPIPDRKEKGTEDIAPTIVPILRTASNNIQPSSFHVHFAELPVPDRTPLKDRKNESKPILDPITNLQQLAPVDVLKPKAVRIVERETQGQAVLIRRNAIRRFNR